MTTKEADRFHYMKLILNKSLSQKNAAIALGCSDRHVRRLLKKYKQKGEEGLISQRRGNPSNNRIRLSLQKQVIDLINYHYSDFGPTLATEKLRKSHGIYLSIETIRNLMIREGIWKPKTKKRLYVHQRRPRRSRIGELIQTDGSPHRWFEDRGPACCLLIFVDDATSRIMFARFYPSENTMSYIDSTKTYLGLYGRPTAFYTDKHSVFRVTRKNLEEGRNITQYTRGLKRLGIDLICANSPQAKGRVERSFRVLQDRLVKEMRLNNISGIDEGNAYLPEFIEEYNERFSKAPYSKEDAHRRVLKSHNLERIFAQEEKRTLSKNLTFQYENSLYQIKIKDPGYRLRGAKVTVVKEKPEEIKIEYEGKRLKYERWEEKTHGLGREIGSKELLALWPNRRRNKPGKNHPWR